MTTDMSSQYDFVILFVGVGESGQDTVLRVVGRLPNSC